MRHGFSLPTVLFAALLASSIAVLLACAAGCAGLLNADFDRPGMTPDASVDGMSPEAGAVSAACHEGEKACNGGCVAVDSPSFGCASVLSCDPCSISHATAACTPTGMCTVGTCDPGRANCSRSDHDCATNAMTDPDNCGVCGHACAADQVCARGGCVTSCPADLTRCGRSCVDLASDDANCGACGTVCPTPASGGVAVCANRVCGTKCNSGFHACGGACVAETPQSCGPSCAACPAPANGNGTATCTAGTCGVKCADGFAPCAAGCCPIATGCGPSSCASGCCAGGVCQPGTAPSACGIGGAACASCTAPANGTATCSGGTCGTACNGGAVLRGGSCTVPIAAGSYHTCALTSGGGVKCWGYNGSGQLGNNSTTDSHVPVAVTGLTSGVLAVVAGAGGNHTCALTSGGGVQCWGDNTNGQLGNNSTAESHVPAFVSGLGSGILAIAAGVGHTCALTSGGGVQCWGANGVGQLGNDSTTGSRVPVTVSGLTSGVISIAAGYEHTCALTSGGGVQCWGRNGAGQLGDNSTTDRHVPVAVSGLTSGVLAVAAGNGFSCALASGGRLQCWGFNGNGQLGNNTTVQSSVPVGVSGLTSGVQGMTAGWAHTCALVNGGAECWGYDASGQLGINSTEESLVPATVWGLASGVLAIAAGGGHTCALTSGGGIRCWGDNPYGQLGDNSTTQSLVPVAVTGF